MSVNESWSGRQPSSFNHSRCRHSILGGVPMASISGPDTNMSALNGDFPVPPYKSSPTATNLNPYDCIEIRFNCRVNNRLIIPTTDAENVVKSTSS